MKAVSKTFLLISFVAMAGFGFLAMDLQGDMSGCIFTGYTMLCKMNVVEHISLWQGVFAATLHKTSILALLLVLVFVVGLSLFRRYLLYGIRLGISLVKQFLNRQPNDIFFDSIKYALAQGILHPRIYEPAHL